MILRLLQILLFFLPLHGLISVFEVPYLRFWKEGVLLLLAISWGFYEFRSFLNKKSVQYSLQEGLSISFLIWLLALVFINEDAKTALIAARYLGVGIFVFFLVSRLVSLGKIKKDDIHLGAKAFVFGVCLSVLFGIWAHFFGGYDVLQHWYSQTISSWVPGQTIPLYHETAGLIRMQGASSGPVEFSHLVLLAWILLPFTKMQPKNQRSIGVLFFVGIVVSLTRAVWLGGLLYLAFLWVQERKVSFKKLASIAAVILVFFGGLLLIPKVQEVVLRSESTQEHITRPLEVLKIGLKNPILGNLGEIGPAARAKNLELYNNDKAPIAENIFIDIAAQTGVIGILIIGLFFSSFFFKRYNSLKPIIVVLFFLGSLASIFDMTPIAITFYLFIAILYNVQESKEEYLSR